MDSFKRLRISDPVHGYINVPSKLIQQIVEHPWFQRLRRIKQLGLTDYVYPGAGHTRFFHSLGAMHLADEAIKSLREKGHYIFDNETEGCLIGILLHDIGHGPYSHALEHLLLDGITHEEIGALMMRKLDEEFHGRLQSAIQIFQGLYPRKFLTELISSQLDMDRLDYLKRDSFFTGVIEGDISTTRIVQMLDLHEGSLVVDERGLYSVENFLNARRLMYWQVYLHKTTVCAEEILIQTIKRAKYLINNGLQVQGSENLLYFLSNKFGLSEMENQPDVLARWCALDDVDIQFSVKQWVNHPDKVLSVLADALVSRNLFAVKLYDQKPDQVQITEAVQRISKHFGISKQDAEWLCLSGEVSNAMYSPEGTAIKILRKTGEIVDISDISQIALHKQVSQKVTKYYYCVHKRVML